jgi:alcohol dehydrogenase (cytochrome c)/methanol dehydrogenase (cytochrome c) subunit 1
MKHGNRLALAAALLLPVGAAYANDELLKLQNDDKQWVMARKNYSATGYSTLNQITTANVKQLKQAWSFSTGALRGHEGAPLVVGSNMYVHSSFSDSESSPGNHIYALDLAKEGAPIKWTYTPKTDKRAVPVAC